MNNPNQQNGGPKFNILNTEQLRKVYGVLTKMKQEGKEGDPNYRQLLLLFNQNVGLIKQNQQSQQQSQQQQNNNITNNQNFQANKNPPQNPIQQTRQTMNSPNIQNTHQQAPAKNNPVEQLIFSQTQKDQLKAQIYALRNYIEQMLEPPNCLKLAVRGIDTEVNLAEYEAMFLNMTPSRSQTPGQQQPIQHTPIQQQPPQQQPQHQPNLVQHNFPQQQQQIQQQPMHTQQQQQQQTSAPSQIMGNPQQNTYNGSLQNTINTVRSAFGADNANAMKPNGLDLPLLYSEREKRISTLMKGKYVDMKEVVQNKSLSQRERIKAAIEMKKLQLLSFQRKVRQELVSQMRVNDQNRINDARPKFTTKMIQKEVRGNTRRNVEVVTKRTSQHKKFLTDLMNTRKNMRDFHKNRTKKAVEKINKELTSFHERRAKLEREKKERQERARLKALKENDHVAYMKLLEEAKEGRFEELVKKTDEILRRLGAQLVGGRDDKKTEKESDASSNSAQAEHSIYSKYLESQNNYYSVAHKLTEKIEEQPSMLVGGKLKPYQMAGLQWMVSLYNNKLNGILADEMGLGKTIQTISLLTFVMQHKNDMGPHLVIVPLSTIENWWLEFERWAPHIKVCKYTGHKSSRANLQALMKPPYKFNVCLTQYEYISRDKKYLKKVPWNYIIMDEGHRIKNANCKLVTDLYQYSSRHRVLLTGTPLQNDLTELWALLHFLLPKVFDSSVNFEEWFSSPINSTTGEKSNVQMTEEETLLIIHRLHQVLRPFLLRREKRDVEDQLPEKIEKIIRCDLSAMQKRFYNDISKHNKVMLDTGETGQRKNMSLNNTVMQLRKVCNHPYLFLERHPELLDTLTPDDMIRTSGKFELLSRMLPKLKATNHRVLLFSQMTGLLDIMTDFLDQLGYQNIRLDGNVKAGDRGQLVKDFNSINSNIFVFLLSTRAGGLGLNLQSADTVIIFDSDWNPQQDLQAMARAHRIGQTKKVAVFRLVTSDTVEERIHDVAQQKRSEEARVIKAGLFNQKSTHNDRHEMLTRLIKNNDLGDAVPESDIPNDAELNHIIARSEQELIVFQKMDEVKEKEVELLIQQGRPPLPPLMTEDELPEWLQDGDKVLQELQEEVKAENFGRGKRSRGAVKYSVDRDPLLDSEDDEDEDLEGIGSNEEEEEEEEEEKPKRGRKSAGAATPSSTGTAATTNTPKKVGRKRKVEEVISEEEEEEEMDENGRPKRKKRAAAAASAAKTKAVAEVKGKKRGRIPKKQIKEDSDDDDDEEKLKYDVTMASLPHEKQKRLYHIWRTLVTLNPGTHQVAEFFMELPDPKQYADYYVLIQNPIAFDSIEQKIINNQYSSILDMEADVVQLCLNAQTYNQEGSRVFNDSLATIHAFNREKELYMQTGGDLVGGQVVNPNNLSIVDDDFGMDGGMSGDNAYEQPPF